MNRKLAGLVLVALVVTGLTTGCVDRKAQEQGRETQKVVTDPAVAVQVEAARLEAVPSVLNLTGALRSSNDVQVGSKAAGRIQSVWVREGDLVDRGQAVARLEGLEASARLSQAQAAAASAASQLDQALTDAKSAPQRSQAAVRAAEARLTSAKESLRRLNNGARTPERQQAKNNVARTQSDLDFAQRAVDRAQRLFDQGALAQTDLEAAQNRFENARVAHENSREQLSLTQDAARPEDLRIAEQQVRQAEEDLRSARANKQLDPTYQSRIEVARASHRSALDQVRLARQAVADLTIVAPTSGRVTGAPLQPGTVVSPGVAVARIVNLDGLYFDAEIGETDVAKVQEGHQVKVALDAIPNLSLDGHVRSVEAVASSVGRLYSVRIELDQKPARLRAGMFAYGEVTLEVDKGAVTVPSSCVVVEGDRRSVFVAASGKVKKLPVKVKTTVGTRSSVEGILPGDKVVTKGQSTLVDGSVVKVEAGA